MAEFNARGIASLADDALLPLTRAAKPASPAAKTPKRRKGQPEAAPDALAVDPYDLTAMGQAEKWAGYGVQGALLFQLPHFLGLGNFFKNRGWHTAAAFVEVPNTYTFRQAGEALGVNRLVAPVAQIGMEGVATATDALQLTGFTGAMSGWNAKRLAGTMRKMEPDMHLVKQVHDQLRTPELKEAVGGALNLLHMGPEHWHGESLQKAMTEAGEALAKVEGAEAASKALARLHTKAGKAGLSHFLADGYANISKHARESGVKSMADTPIAHGMLQNGAFLFFGLASAYRTGYDLNKKMHAAQRLCAALTGKKEKDISWMQVMLGSMPNTESGAVMGAIRHGLIAEFGPAALAEIANNALNIRMTVSSRLSGSIMTQIAFNMASGMWRQFMGETTMPSYMTLTEAESRHQPIPAEAITAFLGQVVPPLRARGADKSNFAIALGEEYAKVHAAGKITIDGIVAEIGNGALMKRVAKIQEAHAHDAPVPQAAQAHAEQASAAQTPAAREAWRKHLDNPQANFRDRHDVAANVPHGHGV